MEKFDKPIKITMTMQFDSPEAFGEFCKMLIDGGHEEAVKALAGELLQEAKRRKLPVAKELGRRIAKAVQP